MLSINRSLKHIHSLRFCARNHTAKICAHAAKRHTDDNRRSTVRLSCRSFNARIRQLIFKFAAHASGKNVDHLETVATPSSNIFYCCAHQWNRMCASFCCRSCTGTLCTLTGYMSLCWCVRSYNLSSGNAYISLFVSQHYGIRFREIRSAYNTKKKRNVIYSAQECSVLFLMLCTVRFAYLQYRLYFFSLKHSDQVTCLHNVCVCQPRPRN